MSNNDPKRNRNNLLFKPNNSINDGQPTIFIYSKPTTSLNTTDIPSITTETHTETSTSENSKSHQVPDVSHNILSSGVEQSSAVSFFDSLYQSNTTSSAVPLVPSCERPPTISTSVPLFPASEIHPTVPSAVPISSTFGISSVISSVPLFSTSQLQPTAFPAIPTLPTTETPIPSSLVPLFSTSQIPSTAVPTVPTFPPSETSSIASSSVPLFPSDIPSSALPTVPTFSRSEPSSSVPLLPASEITYTGPPFVPLFSSSELPSKSIASDIYSSGSINNYRRIGTKRPIYAPIPGLTNTIQQSQTNQFGIYEPSSTNSLTSASNENINVLTPQQFVPNITPKPVLKDLFVPTASSQSNSPFLNPVSEPAELLNSEASTSSSLPGSIIPAMGSNDAQISANLMFPFDDKLPSISEAVTTSYKPPNHHWFYKKEIEGRVTWEPFSKYDSFNLEANFTSHDLSPEKDIPTDGGRYSVNILRRQRTSVYWNGKPSEVRRCSWFHKGHTDGKYVPFEENIATKLEEEYKLAIESNEWHKRINLPSGEVVMFHTPDILVSFSVSQLTVGADNLADGQARPGIIKRGVDEYHIDEGESDVIDHLLFMVHGIGSGCDLKFRSVEEVVDDFRNVALQLVRTHYRSSCDRKVVNRVEILPISWHDKLHSEDTGIDNKLKSITLESIPKLREFTNDTLLDILFYSSPFYGQTIISSVGSELNRIYDLFKQRNPDFKGGISLAGHSLGSLILFDILCNQLPAPKIDEEMSNDDEISSIRQSKPHPLNRKMSRRISYMMGKVGTGQAQVNYPRLNFQPCTFFALGSPIGMFVTIRGLDNLGERFALPTCPGFFNIFHPYDPVAYRIESLVNPQLANVKPVLIPHHKGRKRMHLELKETMAKVGSDLKQKLVDSMKHTWNSLLGWSNNKPSIQPAIAEEVDKVLEQFANKHSNSTENDDQASTETVGLNLGMLNNGRRIDYVLQEAPVEFFNEYIFALSSHVCYWESEDTVLLILKEIYSMLNVAPDCQIPQQTMTIERPPSSSRTPDIPSNSQVKMGMDPTAPIKRDTNIGPPPLSGFVKET